MSAPQIALRAEGLTKAYGSANPVNLVKATLAALSELRTLEQVAELRGVKL